MSIGNTHTHSYCYTNCNANSNSNAYSNSNTYTGANADTNCHFNANSNGDSYTRTDYSLSTGPDDRPYQGPVANGGHVANANGYDIGFYADSGGTTKLKWEVERYDGTTGRLIAWVKIPSVSSSTDTVFYLMYGDSSITTDQSDPLNTWESNFKGVYHLGDGSTVVGTDSTGQAAGTKNGTLTAGAGKINGDITGMSGNSSNYISLANPSSFPITTSWTVSAWLKPVPGNHVAVFWGQGSNNGPHIGMNYPIFNSWRVAFWGGATCDGGSLDTNNLQQIVGTFDGSNLRLYKNGSLVAGPTAATPSSLRCLDFNRIQQPKLAGNIYHHGQ